MAPHFLQQFMDVTASLEDIRLWLRRYKRTRITRAAIHYRLQYWKEKQPQ